MNSSTYLGQVVPTKLFGDPIPAPDLKAIFGEVNKIYVYTASRTPLKHIASATAVSEWVKNNFPSAEIVGLSADAPSEIHEQPIGREQTTLGAANRMKNLTDRLSTAEICKDLGNTLLILVSMENGLIAEKIPNLKNPTTFEIPGEKSSAWVDRCVVQVKIRKDTREWQGEAISKGVTAPVACVKSSAETNWSETAGAFIEKTYRFDAKDWHKEMAGISRKKLISDTVLTALKNSIPPKFFLYWTENNTL